MPREIEDIILQFDNRGVSSLRQHLPSRFCKGAARLVLDNFGTVFVVTGFYIAGADKPETDGPPGALSIGNALAELGYKVYYVTDPFTAPLISEIVGDEAEGVIHFPLLDDVSSRRYARELIEQCNPSILICIERCGITRDQCYLNMRGADITRYSARMDYLFQQHPKTVGIGDGGNEIGMGNLAEVIPGSHPDLPRNPCVTRVTNLIIASVSNWGGYGLVAAISEMAGRNLLPAVNKEWELVERMVELGAVDGLTGEQIAAVDGFSREVYCGILSELHASLADKGIG